MKPVTFILILLLLTLCSCSERGKPANVEAAKGLIGHVELTNPMDKQLIDQGTDLFIIKCARCHTMDTVVFSVPAFAGVTNRRSPEWIMNMIINVDQMLKYDPIAADLLKKHKIVMPDPELDVDEARAVLEFLRSNDLVQVGKKDQARDL